jgi:hypothetical protein
MKYLFFLSTFVCSCTAPFKGGTFYQVQDFPFAHISMRHVYYENGLFEAYIERPRRLIDKLESGTWRAKGNTIEVTTDSIYFAPPFDSA